jgi:hypothetical protein
MSTEDDENELENRIAARAFQIWIDAGQPYGRQDEHWELAKLAIAQEDGMASSLVKPAPQPPEQVERLEKPRGDDTADKR